MNWSNVLFFVGVALLTFGLARFLRKRAEKQRERRRLAAEREALIQANNALHRQQQAQRNEALLQASLRRVADEAERQRQAREVSAAAREMLVPDLPRKPVMLNDARPYRHPSPVYTYSKPGAYSHPSTPPPVDPFSIAGAFINPVHPLYPVYHAPATSDPGPAHSSHDSSSGWSGGGSGGSDSGGSFGGSDSGGGGSSGGYSPD